MKYLIISLLIFTACATAPAIQPSSGATASLTVEDIRGEPLSLQLKGATIVHFWAPWCPTCVSEFQSISDLKRMLSLGRVELVTIALDTPLSQLKEFQRRFGTSIPLYRATSKKLREQFSISGLPVTLCLDAQGNEIPFPDPDSGHLTNRAIGPRNSWGTMRTASRIAMAVGTTKSPPTLK